MKHLLSFLVLATVVGCGSAPSHNSSLSSDNPTGLEDGGTSLGPDGLPLAKNKGKRADAGSSGLATLETIQDSGSKPAQDAGSDPLPGSDSGAQDAGQPTQDDAGSTTQDAGQPACTKDAPKCDGTTAMTCDPNGTWSSQMCDFVCMNGSCGGVCVPGAHSCSGLNAQTCGTNGQWHTDLTCQFACSAGVCTGACTPGTHQCSGLDAQTCNASGRWVTDQTCPFVCSAGSCGGVCSPGTKVCSSNAPKVCDSTGTWQTGSACSFVCSAGSCGGVCSPGAKQCNGLQAQTCDSTGQWHTDQTCGSLCSAGVCYGTCTPGAMQCSSNVPQTCDSNGVWQDGTACPFACSAGACTGECTPSTTQCSGSQIQTCDSTSHWAAPTDCGAVAGATAYCQGAGSCTFNCNLDYDDCDGNPANGCEVNLNTDGNNCGVCGHSCCGGTCGNGTCNAYDSGITANAYAVDQNNLYWTDGAALYKKPRVGGSSSTVTSVTGSARITDIATGVGAAIGQLAWSVNSQSASSQSGVYSMPAVGGSITTQFSATGPDPFEHLTYDTSHLYWSINGGSGIFFNSTSSPNPNPSAPYLVFGNDGTGKNAITNVLSFTSPSNGSLYVTQAANKNTIIQTPAAVNGTAQTFASFSQATGYWQYQALASDATNVYYLFYNSATMSQTGVWKKPITGGGAATQLVSVMPATSLEIATNSKAVFYFDHPSGQATRLMRVPVSAGTPVPLATVGTAAQPSVPSRLRLTTVQGQSCIYWMDGDYDIHAVAELP